MAAAAGPVLVPGGGLPPDAAAMLMTAENIAGAGALLAQRYGYVVDGGDEDANQKAVIAFVDDTMTQKAKVVYNAIRTSLVDGLQALRTITDIRLQDQNGDVYKGQTFEVQYEHYAAAILAQNAPRAPGRMLTSSASGRTYAGVQRVASVSIDALAKDPAAVMMAAVMLEMRVSDLSADMVIDFVTRLLQTESAYSDVVYGAVRGVANPTLDDFLRHWASRAFIGRKNGTGLAEALKDAEMILETGGRRLASVLTTGLTTAHALQMQPTLLSVRRSGQFGGQTAQAVAAPATYEGVLLHRFDAGVLKGAVRPERSVFNTPVCTGTIVDFPTDFVDTINGAAFTPAVRAVSIPGAYGAHRRIEFATALAHVPEFYVPDPAAAFDELRDGRINLVHLRTMARQFETCVQMCDLNKTSDLVKEQFSPLLTTNPAFGVRLFPPPNNDAALAKWHYVDTLAHLVARIEAESPVHARFFRESYEAAGARAMLAGEAARWPNMGNALSMKMFAEFTRHGCVIPFSMCLVRNAENMDSAGIVALAGDTVGAMYVAPLEMTVTEDRSFIQHVDMHTKVCAVFPDVGAFIQMPCVGGGAYGGGRDYEFANAGRGNMAPVTGAGGALEGAGVREMPPDRLSYFVRNDTANLGRYCVAAVLMPFATRGAALPTYPTAFSTYSDAIFKRYGVRIPVPGSWHRPGLASLLIAYGIVRASRPADTVHFPLFGNKPFMNGGMYSAYLYWPTTTLRSDGRAYAMAESQHPLGADGGAHFATYHF